MNLRDTKRFWRSRLPHWEVVGGIYFITIRCHGSLPKSIQARIAEMQRAMESIEPASNSFLVLQRQLFATCEKYLDKGEGFAPFRESTQCSTFVSQLIQRSTDSGWATPHYCVMPNHIHLLSFPTSPGSHSLKTFVTRLKGFTARTLNLQLGRKGAFWQREWFDRWIRNEAELNRTINYIRDNPVKAGLVPTSNEYPFLR